MFAHWVSALLLATALQASPPDNDAITPPTDETIGLAEAGDPDALFEVAWYDFMQEIGSGDMPDPAVMNRVQQQLGHAGDQGHGPSLNLLGTITENGYGLPPNPRAALVLYSLAHEAGEPAGSLNLATRLLFSNTPEDVAEGVSILQQLVADAGAPEARIPATGYLGFAQAHGVGGLEADPQAGIEGLETALAADPGNAVFHFMLAGLYEQGADGETDMASALAHYQAAAEAGHGQAAWQLGMRYLEGAGTEPDPEAAFRYVSMAAEAGDEDGMLSLAVMYALGQGTPANPANARGLYWQLASVGNAHAMRGLGGMLLVGEGGEAEPARGYALIALAAEAGDSMAQQLLVSLAPQLPDTHEWTDAVAEQRRWFLDTSGLQPGDIYGAQSD